MRLCAHRQTFEIENYGPIGNLVEFFGSSCKLSRKTDPAVISAPSDRSRRKKKSENRCLSVQLVSRSALIQSYYSSSTNPLKPWTCFHIRVTYGMAGIFSSHLRLWSGIEPVSMELHQQGTFVRTLCRLWQQSSKLQAFEMDKYFAAKNSLADAFYYLLNCI